MEINILGETWEIHIVPVVSDKQLNDTYGYADETVRKIVVDDFKERKDGDLINLDRFRKKVIRNEIIHAFLIESGLKECSGWAVNEEMVDWFARQFEKIEKAIRQAGGHDEE